MILSTIKKNRISGVSVLFLLLLWETLSRSIDREIIFPSLLRILGELQRIVTNPQSWLVIGKTMQRTAGTFLLDLLLALMIGVPAGLWRRVEQSIKPLETAFRAVPTMGIVLLALIWLESETTPVFVSSLIVFPILYRAVVDGIHHVDSRLIEFHTVHKVGAAKTLRHLYIPSLLPFLKMGINASLGLCLKVMITAEVLSQPSLAIGTVFQIERAMLNTAAVIAWCIVVIALSALLDGLVNRLFFKKEKELPDAD